MFDLVAGSTERPLTEWAPGSTVVSVALHAIVLTLAIGLPLLRVTNTLPEVPTIMAFVAPAPAAPLPAPPPPPAAAARAEPAPKPPRPADTPTGPLVAPEETPREIALEAAPVLGPRGGAVGAGVEGGLEGGIEGGVVGGVPGGMTGGIASNVPPPPPPPPTAAPQAPVRIGGEIKPPALRHRVEPRYPDIAAASHLTGLVILEAVVGTDGCVESVKVVRSRHPLLDRAAVEALKQWEYSPLVLDGTPMKFVLTVTFTFSAKS